MMSFFRDLFHYGVLIHHRNFFRFERQFKLLGLHCIEWLKWDAAGQQLMPIYMNRQAFEGNEFVSLVLRTSSAQS